MALGTCTKFQLEILTINLIFETEYFRKIILESSCNASETTPWSHHVDLKILVNICSGYGFYPV